MDKAKKPIDAASIAQDILVRWRDILMIAATCAMLTFMLAGQLFRPQYRSSATLIVSSRSNSGNTYSNFSAALDITSAFSLVLDSEALRTQVSRELGESVPEGTITATSIAETNLLTLSVTADRPDKAFRIIQKVQEVYPNYLGSLMGAVTVQVLEPARVPAAPVEASPASRYAKYALVLGALAAMALFGVLSYMRDTVKSADEVNDKLETRLLVSVPRQSRRMRRRGHGKRQRKVSLLVTNAGSDFWFTEAYKKLRARVLALTKHDKKVLLVTSTFENEGKSTTCTNLALLLQQMGKKVLLIDGDMRKPALHKVLEHPIKLSMSYARYLGGHVADWHDLVHHQNGVSLLLFGKAAGEKAEDWITSARMQKLLDEAREEYDYILIDTPPMAAAPDTREEAALADAAIIVVHYNTALAMDINDSIAMLKENTEVLGCVFNGAPTGLMAGSHNHKYGYGYGEQRYSAASPAVQHRSAK